MARPPNLRLPRLPFEFIVRGVPISVNSRRRENWQYRVRSAAATAFGPNSLLDGELQVIMIHYYRDGSLDVDNMIKPILDALIGTVYEDDNLVGQVLARKTQLLRGLEVAGASAQVLSAISRESDFVFLRVDGPPGHGAMP